MKINRFAAYLLTVVLMMVGTVEVSSKSLLKKAKDSAKKSADKVTDSASSASSTATKVSTTSAVVDTATDTAVTKAAADAAADAATKAAADAATKAAADAATKAAADAATKAATGSATGATGSATGATGSAAGATGSATGATGSATGATGSVTGATGSVTGATGTTDLIINYGDSFYIANRTNPKSVLYGDLGHTYLSKGCNWPLPKPNAIQVNLASGKVKGQLSWSITSTTGAQGPILDGAQVQLKLTDKKIGDYFLASVVTTSSAQYGYKKQPMVYMMPASETSVKIHKNATLFTLKILAGGPLLPTSLFTLTSNATNGLLQVLKDDFVSYKYKKRKHKHYTKVLRHVVVLNTQPVALDNSMKWQVSGDIVKVGALPVASVLPAKTSGTKIPEALKPVAKVVAPIVKDVVKAAAPVVKDVASSAKKTGKKIGKAFGKK